MKRLSFFEQENQRIDWEIEKITMLPVFATSGTKKNISAVSLLADADGYESANIGRVLAWKVAGGNIQEFRRLYELDNPAEVWELFALKLAEAKEIYG